VVADADLTRSPRRDPGSQPARDARGIARLALRHAARRAGASRRSSWTGTRSSTRWLAAASGDVAAAHRAQATLHAERRLLDPVWGGIYQYIRPWGLEHPHFEKLLAFQAEVLRTYALAYASWRNPEDLARGREIHRYMKAFLRSPDGAFYVSQDADLVRGEHGGQYFSLPDRERRAQGVPRIDTHTYARETAWAGTALVALSAASGEREPLDEAARRRTLRRRRTLSRRGRLPPRRARRSRTLPRGHRGRAAALSGPLPRHRGPHVARSEPRTRPASSTGGFATTRSRASSPR
jgi:uncharacterized protein YyaL (SSP411 family)